MPLVHVRWEKTLFGLLYHTPRAAMFQAYLANMSHSANPSVYGELFYAQAETQLGSFTYSHHPLSQVSRSHITLWSGHEEQLMYKLDARRQLVLFQYSLVHAHKPAEWACIPRAVKDALRAKTDDAIVLSKCSTIE